MMFILNPVGSGSTALMSSDLPVVIKPGSTEGKAKKDQSAVWLITDNRHSCGESG